MRVSMVQRAQCSADDDLNAGDDGVVSSETAVTPAAATMATTKAAIAVTMATTTATTLTPPLRGTPHATLTTTTMMGPR